MLLDWGSMEILYILLILLITTRVFGEIAVRCGQPALVGELVSGIVLGVVFQQFPSIFPTLANLTKNEVFLAITDLGVFFLMLLAGVQMRPKELLKGSAASFMVAAGGMAVPLAMGFALAWWFVPASEYKVAQVMFVATTLAITAVPVAVKVLMDLGKLDSQPGRILVAAAIFDDILSLILLGVLTSLIADGEFPGLSGLGLIVLKMILFLAVTASIGIFVFPWIGKRIRFLQDDELEFSFLIVAALAFAVLAERLGLHFILGAFVAGLFFVRKTMDTQTHTHVKSKVSALTTGFLAPVFFASIGLHLQYQAIILIPFFLVLLILAAFASKLLGAGLMARLIGMSRKDSLMLGVGMSARGAVELIIADIALRAGLFTHPAPAPPIIANLFSAVVIMAIVTTLFVPIFLRMLTPQRT